MWRVWITLALVMGFAGCVLLIRAQPYQDAELRSLFTDGNCPIPCFLGIRPGLTNAIEANAMLSAHPWVRAETIQSDLGLTGRTVTMRWRWAEAAPKWLIIGGELHIHYDPVADRQQVQSVLLWMAHWGDLVLTYGPHSQQVRYRYDTTIAGLSICSVRSWYEAGPVLSEVEHTNHAIISIWEEPVVVTLFQAGMRPRLPVVRQC
jgi:hypothetical protein